MPLHPAPDPDVTAPVLLPAEKRSTVTVAAGTAPDDDATASCQLVPDTDTRARPPAVPGYEIEAVLGRGGMGVVYRARHVALKRTVALKVVLAGGHAGPAERARFCTEAEAVARLQHPNIVQIHEVGEADGLPYCALEFVGGGTLADRLRDGPLSPREAAGTVEQLARAMQLAHSRNVVHRDLKPGNVLLGTDHVPKVTDFGLARRLDDDSGMTRDGAVMGTPSYMAPEQAAGRTHEAGPAADTYALGAILYACLAGRPPFKGATVAETLDWVRTREPEPPSRIRPGVPRDLETICLKCLRKQPEARYSSAQELADDLDRFLRHEPITARPVGRVERFRLWWRRNPALAPLLTVLVLLVLGTAVTAVAVAFRFAKLADDLTDALGKEQTANEKTVAALGKANRALGLSLQAEAGQAWAAGNVAQARERLAAVDPAARFWEWGYLNRLYNPTGFHPEATDVWHVAWSPDGGTLAAGTNAGEVVLRDGATGAVRHRIAAHVGGILALAFAPDGRHLATVGEDGAARVWVTAGGRPLRALAAPGGDAFTTLAWPHGRWIAVGCRDGRVRLWDALADRERPPLPAPPAGNRPGSVSALAFDPSGRTLARATHSGHLTLLRLDGTPPRPIPGEHAVSALTFSPDGALLAAGGEKLELFDTATGAVVRELPIYPSKPEGYRYLVTGLDFRGDGSQLASSCGGYGSTNPSGTAPDTTARIWDVSSGRTVRTLRSLGGPIQSVRFSPDGQRLAGGVTGVARPGTAGVGVWDVRADGDHRLLCGSDFRPLGLAAHPDGRRVVTVGGTNASATPGELVVWDVIAGARVARRDHTVPIWRVAIAPDGQTLLTADIRGTLDVWDATTLERTKTIPNAHAGMVAALDVLSDGRPVSFGEDGRVRVWNAATGATVAELVRPTEDGVKCPIGAAHPRAARVAVGSRRVNTDGAEEVFLWHPDDGTTTPLGTMPSGTTALTFSADGTLLAAVGLTGELAVWEVETRTERLRFQAHPFGARGVAFHPDGRRIATAAADRAIRVWDVETGREALALTGPRFAGDCLRFTPDGGRLVAAGGGGGFETLPFDGEVWAWDATPFTDTAIRPDAAWHAARIVVNAGTDPTALTFHGRYAVADRLPSGTGWQLVRACGDMIRQARPDDPRLPAFRQQLRATADAVAAQRPDDPDVRRALAKSAVAMGPSDPIRRNWWARELAERPVSPWALIAAGAYLDGDPGRVRAATAKSMGDTPLTAALVAWALARANDPAAPAARTRARELVRANPDPLADEVLNEGG